MTKRSTTYSKAGPTQPGFVLDNYLMYNLVRATAVYNDVMEAALKSHGLSTATWRILMLLDDKSPISVSDLARRAVMKTPTVTRMLIRLEEDGLVKRTIVSDDRRYVNVTMTPKALKTLRAAQEVGQRVFQQATEDVSSNEISIATDMLKRMRTSLQRSPFERAPAKAQAS